IAVFFYDGGASNAIAFGGLAGGPEGLARLLVANFGSGGGDPIVSVATDGETYGHHFKGGDRGLSGALSLLEAPGGDRIPNFAEHPPGHPPAHQARIRENTSWSCPHGVGRWKEECGCSTGEHPGWRQSWRAPLREALVLLRERLDAIYEAAAAKLFRAPREARDNSSVLLLSGPADPGPFLHRPALRP